MLTRLVRTQLVIFTIASLIGLTAMVFGYMQVPTWLGVGHITVTVELPGTGGLYRFANVTYRGVQIGKVSRVEPTGAGATATLSLNDSPKVPADVQANVRSVSAVGEQYVDLIPRGAGPPFLADGSVIRRDNTTVPLKVGPVLDQLSAFVGSVPDELSGLLDESFPPWRSTARVTTSAPCWTRDRASPPTPTRRPTAPVQSFRTASHCSTRRCKAPTTCAPGRGISMQ